MKLQEVCNKYYFQLLTFSIILIGVLLRSYNLVEQSYWLDELYSVDISSPDHDFTYVVNETLKGAPPLYQVLLWVWYNIVGFNELSGRLLSVIFGSLSLIFIYLLGKELFNRDVGIFALLITALNQFLISYSQETRSYSLLFLLSIISTFFFVKFFYKKKNIFLFFYFFTIIGAFYTHYFGFFVLVFHMVFVLIYKNVIPQQSLKYFLFVFGLIVMSTIPLLNNILELANIQGFWIAKPKIYFWVYYFNTYFQSFALDIVFILLILNVAFRFSTYSKRYKYSAILLICWIAISYILPFVRSIVSTPLLTERNTIMVIPAIILLIALGLYCIKNRIIKSFIIFIIIVFSFFQLYHSQYYYKTKKQQWRSVLTKVNDVNSKPNYPIYDIVFEGRLYMVYAKLLGLKMKINNREQLIQDIEKHKTLKTFWILDAHENNIGKLKFLKEANYKILKSMEYKNTKAILVTDLNK